MYLTRLLAACTIAGSASAQLLTGRSFDKYRAQSRSAGLGQISQDAQDQLRLTDVGYHGSSSADTFKQGQYTLREQDGSICSSNGEAQYTGTIDVSDERRLFFWFFESRNDPVNDPVVIWMNGGPGGSSQLGLFQELGPCLLAPESNYTMPNPWAWNNNASVLFLDQPAGVGYSSVAEGAPLPSTDQDGAQDFQMFLNIFFADVFPSKAHLPIHIAAESYGGHYSPVYVDHIIKSRAYDSKTAFWGNITSMILVNAVIDHASLQLGKYELFCKESRGEGILTDEQCNAMRLAGPELQVLGTTCDLSYDGSECVAMDTFGGEKIGKFYEDLVDKQERNPFNIHQTCPEPPICNDPSLGNLTHFLNQKHVKEALGMPLSRAYDTISWEVNAAYDGSHTVSRPTTREVANILDAYLKSPSLNASISLLVLNGNEDSRCNTPGNKMTYDQLRWSGQSDYRYAKFEPLPEGDDGFGVSGVWKGTEDGKLVFVAVDGAGHMVPGDQSEAAWKIAQRWFEGKLRA